MLRSVSGFIEPGTSPSFKSVGYVSGRRYLAGPPSVSITSTNTFPYIANTMYGIVTPINQRVTLSGIGLRTSSSNASSSGQFIGVIYSLDGNLLPSSLIAQTPATSVTNSAINTDFAATFAVNVTLEAGNYFFGHLANNGNIRSSVYASNNPWATYTGAATLALALAGSPTMGYKTADGAVTFASGAPATFGAATVLNSATPSAASIVPLIGLIIA
jgi:hypothetical protein